MADTSPPLDYVSPSTHRVRRRSPWLATLASILLPLPVAVALLVLSELDRPNRPPVPPGTLYAAADIRRGNADGDYGVSAQGFMRAGRPVFGQANVYFKRPRGRSLHINTQNLTFHPFADVVRSDGYRPVTRSAMLAEFASRGCDPNRPGTVELADALFLDLQNISAGTVPPGQLHTGPYVAPPDERQLTPLTVVVGWAVLSSGAALVAFAMRRRGGGPAGLGR